MKFKKIYLSLFLGIMSTLLCTACGNKLEIKEDKSVEAVSIMEETNEEKIDLSNTVINLNGFIRENTEESVNLILSWNKIDGVDGYEVCFSDKYKDEEMFRPETVESTKDINYTFSYQDDFIVRAKVRAYKDYSDERVYSLWSDDLSGNTFEDVTEEIEDLPGYYYEGDDEYLSSIIFDLLQRNKDIKCDVLVPYVFPVEINDSDNQDVRVYGNFYLVSYDKEGHKLVSKEIKHLKGLFTIKLTDSGFEVYDFDFTEDDSSKLLSICDDDEKLCDSILNAKIDFSKKELEIINDYVDKNSLLIDRIIDINGNETFLKEGYNLDKANTDDFKIKENITLSNPLINKNTLTCEASIECNVDGYEFFMTEKTDKGTIENSFIQSSNVLEYEFGDSIDAQIGVRAFINNNGEYDYSDWSNVCEFTKN